MVTLRAAATARSVLQGGSDFPSSKRASVPTPRPALTARTSRETSCPSDLGVDVEHDDDVGVHCRCEQRVQPALVAPGTNNRLRDVSVIPAINDHNAVGMRREQRLDSIER
jgi:hypothetical protein